MKLKIFLLALGMMLGCPSWAGQEEELMIARFYSICEDPLPLRWMDDLIANKKASRVLIANYAFMYVLGYEAGKKSKKTKGMIVRFIPKDEGWGGQWKGA